MKLKKFIKLLEKNRNKNKKNKEGDYIQVYGNGKDGNLKTEGRLLSRFSVYKNNICFYFPKDYMPCEYSYDGHYMSLDSDVDEVKYLNHKYAVKLCEVIKRFIADKN